MTGGERAYLGPLGVVVKPGQHIPCRLVIQPKGTTPPRAGE
jgi:hypothetical protein